MSYVIAFAISFAIVVLLIPPLRKFALRIGFVDKPRADSARKIHREPIPLTAGIAIFVGFAAVYLLFIRDVWYQTAAVLGGGLLVLAIGMVDDWFKTAGKEFPALPKFLVQIGAAVLVYASGIQFVGFENPFNGVYVVLPEWLSFLFTILWIFGVTTVINFSDGMDGLAGGLSAISGGTLLVVAHDARNLTEGVGGPKDVSVLYTPEEVAGDLADVGGLTVLKAERVRRPVATPDGERDAIDTLVLARRVG